jgi:hypothetical protein
MIRYSKANTMAAANQGEEKSGRKVHSGNNSQPDRRTNSSATQVMSVRKNRELDSRLIVFIGVAKGDEEDGGRGQGAGLNAGQDRFASLLTDAQTSFEMPQTCPTVDE